MSTGLHGKMKEKKVARLKKRERLSAGTTHHEHDARVDLVPRVLAGSAREAIVRSEVALTLHHLFVAGEGLHREGRGRNDHD